MSFLFSCSLNQMRGKRFYELSQETSDYHDDDALYDLLIITIIQVSF